MKKFLCLISSALLCMSMVAFPVSAEEEIETASDIGLGVKEHMDFITIPIGGANLREHKNCYVQFCVNEDVLGKITKDDFSSGAVTVKAAVREGYEIPEELGEVDSPYNWYRLYFDVTSDVPKGEVLFTFNFPDTLSGDEMYFREITSTTSSDKLYVSGSIIGMAVRYYAYGDVNHDGQISVLDVLAVNQYLLSLRQLDEAGIKSADVDNNGKVDDGDAMKILKSLVGLETLD